MYVLIFCAYAYIWLVFRLDFSLIPSMLTVFFVLPALYIDYNVTELTKSS